VLWGYNVATSILHSEENNISKIQAKNNLNIIADNITNRSSIITAGNNIDIEVNNLTNAKTTFQADNSYTYETHWKRCKAWGCNNKRRRDTYYTTSTLASNTPALLSSKSLNINAINSVTLDSPTLSAAIPIPNRDISGDPTIPTTTSPSTSISPIRSSPHTDSISSISAPHTNSAAVTASTIHIEIPGAGDSLFIKAPPSSQYLIETSPFLNDPSILTGSAYYKSRFGFDPDTSQFKWLGDAFYDWNLINSQITQINHKQQAWASVSWEENLNRLIDNAYVQKDSLGLAPGIKLTANQINKLNSDILWYETDYVNKTTGDICNNSPSVCATNPAYQKTLIAKVYLAKNTFNSISLDQKESAIIAKNVTINSSNLINYGQVIATNNLTLNVRNDLNNYSSIYANNNLDITAKNLNNISQINAVNIRSDIYQTINKTPQIKAGNIDITLENSLNNIGANIEATKNIINQDEINNSANSNKIFAGDDSIPNYQTTPDKIYSTGNVSITAGNDINIAAAALITHTEYKWGGKKNGNSKITNDVNNVSSNIISANDLNLNATGDDDSNISIIGSNLYSNNNTTLTTNIGDINITNAIDSKMSLTESHRKGFMSSKLDQVYDYQETAINSNIVSNGNLAINSNLGSLNITSSNLSANNNLNIGSFQIQTNPDGSPILNANNTFATISGESISGVNISSATLKSEHSEIHQSSSLNLAAIAKIVAFTMVTGVGVFIASEVGAIGSIYNSDSAKLQTINYTQSSSNLNVGNNLNINSTENINIKASNLNIQNNANINITDGSLNIISGQETSKSSSESRSIEIGKLTFNYDLLHASASAGIKGEGTAFESQDKSLTNKSSNINIGNNLFANINNDMTITASNLITGQESNNGIDLTGNVLIRTGDSFNLNSSNNTTETLSKSSSLSLEIGAKVGNAYVDTAYAIKAVVDAEANFLKSVKKLDKIRGLKSQGKASQKAVDLAAAQVALASLAVTTAMIAAQASAAGAAATTVTGGFYGAAYMNSTSSGIKNSNTTSIAQASNFITYGDVDINSNKDINILGSMLTSVSGNTTLTAKNNINIEAATNTITQNSKQETIYGGGSVGNNGVQLNIGFSKGESEYNKTFYTNSEISSQNGTLTLNTQNNATIAGANIAAKDIVLNIGNNLNITSKQSEEDFNSNGFGFSAGVGVGANASSASSSMGFNMSQAEMHRLWTDNITTLTGNNSITINTGTNLSPDVTGDLNLTGAAILSDNITLNVKGSLNKTNLEDSYYSESSGLGIQISLTNGLNRQGQNQPSSNLQPAIPGTGGKPNTEPGGGTTINLSLSENSLNRTTYAMIGDLDSKLTSDTASMLGADFDATLTIDHRLFSESSRASIYKDNTDFGKNLKTMRESEENSPLAIGAILNTPNTVIEGLIYSFQEENSKDGSYLYKGSNTLDLASNYKETDNKQENLTLETLQLNLLNTSGKAIGNNSQNQLDQKISTAQNANTNLYYYQTTNNAATTKYYALNGINTDLATAFNNYISPQEDITLRYNPTHGVLGDLVESGLGKLFKAINMPEVIAMNNYAALDMFQRKDMKASINPITGVLENIPTNVYHSQGSIIGAGGMAVYKDLYMTPITTYNQDGSQKITYTNQIDQSQRFVAVGPAVGIGDWKDSTGSIGLKWNDNNYEHNIQDPVRYLAAPSNLVNDLAGLTGNTINSPIYIPNIFIDAPRAIYDAILHIDQHDVSNPNYSKYFIEGSQNSRAILPKEYQLNLK
jgi:hypothetical protein